MKKIILLPIMILIMSFGKITNVNALNYDQKKVGEQPVFNNFINNTIILTDIEPTNKTITNNFDTNIINNNSDFVEFTYRYNFANNILTDTGAINFTWQTLVVDYGFVFYLIPTSGNWVNCQIDNNKILCPLENDKTYSRISIRYTQSTSTGQYNGAHVKMVFEPSVEFKNYIGTNNTQNIIDNQNQNTTSINNNITNLNDNIINSSINSQTTSDVGNISSNNINTDSKNVVLDFMLMPITFLNNILNSFSNNCATLCLGNCNSGHDNEWYFIFPCVDIKSFIGDTIYNTIDVLMCFGMIFAFLRSVVNFLKKALMLESDISSEVRIF